MSTATPSLKELEATLADPAKIRNMLADGTFNTFIKDYAGAKADATSDLKATVQAEVQMGLAEFLKDNGQVVRPDMSPANSVRHAKQKNAVYNASAAGAPLDKHFNGPADYFQAIWHQADSLQNSDSLREKMLAVRKLQNSYGSMVPADGGFLIPEELRSDLLQLSIEDSIVRPRAQIIPMSSLAVPIPIVDDTSHASSIFGGITAYWTEEGASAAESNAKFGRTRLEAKKLTVYSEAPNELVADAPAFGAFLGRAMPKAIAYYEDDAFINGTGVGEPLGVLNSPAKIAVSRASTGFVKFADVVNMYARMLPQSLNSAVWLASPAVIPQLLQLFMDPGGTTDAIAPPLWLSGGQAISGPTMTLLGRPLIISEKVPDLGEAGDLAFVDFGFYLIGDRQMMQATSSPHFKFRTDETAYKVVERVDGRPWVNSALTPKNGGDTLSPIVTLAA